MNLRSTSRLLVTAAGVLLTIAPLSAAHATFTVQTSDFLTGYTNYNGFEGMGATTSYPSNTPYTEDGITVQYVGSANIWTTSQAAEGNYTWYEYGGGTGYTQVTFADPINALEFQAGSGWFGASPSLFYDVLLGGVSVGSGAISGIANYPGFNFYGFSGVSFDEVRLQARIDGGGSFDPNAFEAGAYDAFNFQGTNGAVPEPSTWAMMLLGFGAVSGALRYNRRKRKQSLSYA